MGPIKLQPEKKLSILSMPRIKYCVTTPINVHNGNGLPEDGLGDAKTLLGALLCTLTLTHGKTCVRGYVSVLCVCVIEPKSHKKEYQLMQYLRRKLDQAIDG